MDASSLILFFLAFLSPPCRRLMSFLHFESCLSDNRLLFAWEMLHNFAVVHILRQHSSFYPWRETVPFSPGCTSPARQKPVIQMNFFRTKTKDVRLLCQSSRKIIAIKLWLSYLRNFLTTTPNRTNCKELKLYNLISCLGLALRVVPQFAKAHWVHVLDLRSNDIRRISVKQLLAFSNLNTLDVRGNACLEYESVQGIRARVSVS